MRKLLLTAATGAYEKPFREYFDGRNRAYAEHWGFEYHPVFDADYYATRWPCLRSKPRHPYWMKIAAILVALYKTHEGDVVSWIDGDVCIVRGDVEFAAQKGLLFTCGSDYDFNTGVLSVKNNQFTRAFLGAVWRRTDCDDHPWQDNEAFIRELKLLTPALELEFVENLPRCMNATINYAGLHDEIRFMHLAGRCTPAQWQSDRTIVEPWIKDPVRF